jgi:hypothetical protein
MEPELNDLRMLDHMENVSMKVDNLLVEVAKNRKGWEEFEVGAVFLEFVCGMVGFLEP